MPGKELIGKEELKEIMDVMETGVLMRYEFDTERKGVYKVRDFEDAFRAYCGVEHALGVTSGSAALVVALNALGIGPEDEVIVPAFTFVATFEAVCEVGAVPVMADIDDTLNLNHDVIESLITPSTRAVIPVHMCGAMARIDEIVAVARRHNLIVLEDTAQSCGGTYKGRHLGTFGNMGTFSFDYVKTITAAEGGMVITNDKTLADRAEWYHDHGHHHDPALSRGQEKHEFIGFNFRMNELQGAVGLAQFRKLDYIVGEQRRNKAKMKEMLSRLDGVGFRAIPDPDGDTATFIGFHFSDGVTAHTVQKALGENGVDAVIYKDNAWHYLPNWEHFLEYKTMNPRKYPFLNPSNKGVVDYNRERIPVAEDLLGRTLFIQIPVIVSDERWGEIERAVTAAKTVLTA